MFAKSDPEEFAAGDYNLYRYCHNDPVNRSDPSGLWPTAIHDQIIDKSLKDKLTDEERQILKNESKAVDKDQSQEGSYKHGMRSPNQTIDQARGAHEKYISQNLHDAIRAQKEGHRTEALRALGRGIHAISDATSPAHEGYQVWNGLPGLFDSGPVAAIKLGLAAAHAASEQAITPAKLDATAILIQSYYQSFEAGSK